jgi:hypothetical protein
METLIIPSAQYVDQTQIAEALRLRADAPASLVSVVAGWCFSRVLGLPDEIHSDVSSVLFRIHIHPGRQIDPTEMVVNLLDA